MQSLIIYIAAIIAGIVVVATVVPLVAFEPEPTTPELTGNLVTTDSNQTPQGNNQNNYSESEFVKAFDTCDSKSEFFEGQGMKIKATINGSEGTKCLVDFVLVDAPFPTSLAIGNTAVCKLSKAEVNSISNNSNITNFDCEGPLYDLAKTFMPSN